MLKSIKTAIYKLRQFDQLVAERDRCRSERDKLRSGVGALFVPLGHFMSPIPSLDEVRRDEEKIFGNIPREIGAVDLYEENQLDLLKKFVPYYKQLPFHSEKTEGLRFFFENLAFPHCDAIMLYCMIRFLKPKRFIEAGSGYSSCVTLDTNELFLAVT